MERLSDEAFGVIADYCHPCTLRRFRAVSRRCRAALGAYLSDCSIPIVDITAMGTETVEPRFLRYYFVTNEIVCYGTSLAPMLQPQRFGKAITRGTSAERMKIRNDFADHACDVFQVTPMFPLQSSDDLERFERQREVYMRRRKKLPNPHDTPDELKPGNAAAVGASATTLCADAATKTEGEPYDPLQHKGQLRSCPYVLLVGEGLSLQNNAEALFYAFHPRFGVPLMQIRHGDMVTASQSLPKVSEGKSDTAHWYDTFRGAPLEFGEGKRAQSEFKGTIAERTLHYYLCNELLAHPSSIQARRRAQVKARATSSTAGAARDPLLAQGQRDDEDLTLGAAHNADDCSHTVMVENVEEASFVVGHLALRQFLTEEYLKQELVRKHGSDPNRKKMVANAPNGEYRPFVETCVAIAQATPECTSEPYRCTFYVSGEATRPVTVEDSNIRQCLDVSWDMLLHSAIPHTTRIRSYTYVASTGKIFACSDDGKEDEELSAEQLLERMRHNTFVLRQKVERKQQLRRVFKDKGMEGYDKLPVLPGRANLSPVRLGYDSLGNRVKIRFDQFCAEARMQMFNWYTRAIHMRAVGHDSACPIDIGDRIYDDAEDDTACKAPSPVAYVADNEILGVTYAEGYYFPNAFLKDVLYKKTEAATSAPGSEEYVHIVDDAAEGICLEDGSYLGTPWLLVGTPGTFSTEHVEPRDSNIWLHLFQGSKTWFLFMKDAEGGGRWEHFVQHPGDTMFLLPDVPHVVVNRMGDDTPGGASSTTAGGRLGTYVTCAVARNFLLKKMKKQ